MVSVLILTLDEELNLPRCLNSLSWCDDVVVLDSYSSDRTEAIAHEYSTRFIQRKFDDYARQRNFGLNDIHYKHPWLLMVDADEAVSPELALEIEEVLGNVREEICLYRMRRKDYFMNQWIRHSSGYPTWFGRLARIGSVRVERATNEEYHTDGEIAYLNQHLLHYPFNKGIHAWIDKHNRYSSMEAEASVQQPDAKIKISSLFNTDPVERRKAIKSLFYSLPGRPILMFLALYFLKRGFLDGKAGLTFCMLRSFYEYMIDCKVKEIRLRQKGSPL
jgi:glycosyltransferase involved in cell wall biosynthesis